MAPDHFSYLTLKTSIFIEDSPGNKYSRFANESQIIFYTFTTFYKILLLFANQTRILIGHLIKAQYRGLVN